MCVCTPLREAARACAGNSAQFDAVTGVCSGGLLHTRAAASSTTQERLRYKSTVRYPYGLAATAAFALLSLSVLCFAAALAVN